MKTKHVLTFVLAVIGFITANAQERGDAMLTIGGGWNSASIENVSTTASGYLINVGFEKFQTPNFSMGGSVHYLKASQDYTSSTVLPNGSTAPVTGKTSVWSVPILFDAKYYFATGKVKPYVKGDLGYQFSGRKISTTVSGSTSEATSGDGGFTAGAGAGLMFALSGKMNLGIDYQWYWINNVYYQEASVNTVSLNLGIKMGH